MQRGSSDRSSRIFILALLALLTIVMVLYFMKRSELSTFQTELILAKSQATEIEEAFNQKVADFQQQIQTQEQKVTNTRSQLNKCEDQLLTSDKEMEEKVTEMVKCNSELNAVQMTMKSSKVEFDDVKTKSNEKTLEIEKLQNQLLTAQSSLQDCENCKTDLYKCQGRISLANQELDACKAKCDNQVDQSLQ